ncbi:hypothetical protein DW004_14455 [Firmicutes bacterium AF36-3BH]|nr:hypothetical protein DW004_14455 [Firmicutes bacterium AF36-3BH]
MSVSKLYYYDIQYTLSTNYIRISVKAQLDLYYDIQYTLSTNYIRISVKAQLDLKRYGKLFKK